MAIDRAANEPRRVSRALQRLSTPGALGGVTLASNSGLELVGDTLRIDIGQNPSLLALDATGLITQFITATGAVPNVGITTAATGTGQVQLTAGSGATTLSLTATVAQFGAGATTYAIDSTTGLLGQIDSDGGATFRIEDVATNTGALVMSSTECLLAGFLVTGTNGSPIRVQPQTSGSASPGVRIQGATGDAVVGGVVVVQGGSAITGANLNSGAVRVIGGIPRGTGTSQVQIQVQSAAPATSTIMEALYSGGAAKLAFYGGTPVAKQTVDIGTAAIHAALVVLGLITSSGTTIAGSVPAGGILMFGGTAAPTGFLLCDGSAVSRTTYAILFAVVSTAFGVGDGSMTFNLPDMRQRFPLGKAAAGTGSTLGGTGGAIDHTHDVDIASFTSGNDNDVGGLTALVAGSPNVALFAHAHPVNPPNTTSTTNNPPFQAVNFIISTGL